MAVAVVGGGIAGLAAAHELAVAGADVVVVEASDRLGGKVLTGEVGGCAVDLGPDAFLARRPEAVQLCDELGLTGELVAPATTEAAVWSRGRLRPLPAGLLLGIPTRPVALLRSGILSVPGALRAALEPMVGRAPAPAHDVAIGRLVRPRLGDEAHERLVDPLLGGINAGDTDHLSVDVCAPQVAAAARRGGSLVRGARHVAAAGSDGPVFLTHRSGLGAVVEQLASRLAAANVDVRTSCSVLSVEPRPGGVRLVTSDARGGTRELDVGAAVLAAPAFVTGPLVAPHAPTAGAVLGGVAYSSVALAVLAYRRADVPRLRGSGFLVPRAEGRLLTAASFASTKWAHVGDDGAVLVRASVGRAGDERGVDLDDDILLDAVKRELAAMAGIDAEPVDAHVARWPRSFPQYAPGHLDRIDAATADLTRHLPGVTLAGAALRGVGLPACIASGRAAARAALATGGAQDGMQP